MVVGANVLLLITHLDAGGAQETVVHLGLGLRDRGFGVTVGARPGGSQAERLLDAGIHVAPLPNLRREIAPIQEVRAYRDIGGLIRACDAQVVHSHSSKAGVLGRIAARRARIPAIVHTSHGLPINPDMGRLERTVLAWTERAAARAGHRVVAVSHATAHELVEMRLARPGRVAVIPSGIDIALLGNAPEPEQARALLGLGEGPVVGWVGRHFPQKRPDQVVAAAKQILAVVPDASVLLVGDGPALEQTRSLAAGEERIHILGHRSDIATVYAAMDVMMLASAWEGLPRTVLEALAVGVPVVSTDVSGVREVVHEGRTGFLVPMGSVDAVARAVVRLLHDRSLRHRMSEEARRVVGDGYSVEFMVDATAALYDELLSSSRRTTP